MEFLAYNRAKVNTRYDSFYHYWGILAGLLSVCLFGMLFYATDGSLSAIVPLAVGALVCYFFALVYLDLYMRWHCASETISIQHEMLVVEYKKSIFKHRKQIPLSAIKDVELYNGVNGWIWGTAPETLRVVYSNSLGYNIGLCMSDDESSALAQRIKDLARKYI